MEAYRKFLKSDGWQAWEDEETDQRKGLPVPAAQKPIPASAQLIDLVPPDRFTVGHMPLSEVIRRRRSRRQYTSEPLTLEALSFLLWATQGIDTQATGAFREWLAGKDRRAVSSRPLLRTVPSAGGRHPFESYLLIDRVENLAQGLYRYLPFEHQLLYLRPAMELAALFEAAFPAWVRQCAVLFIWTTIPYRSEWRYSFMAHKMIAQESGHICQNLYLACEGIGAGACAITYDQSLVDELLGVDGQEEFAIYVAPVGKVAEAAYHFDH